MEVGHGLAGWDCFRGFPETGAGLRSDDGADPVSDAGSSLAVADFCLAELRSVSEISRADGLSAFLAAKTRRSLVLGHGRPFQADQTGRTARHRRRVPPALTFSVGAFPPSLVCLRPNIRSTGELRRTSCFNPPCEASRVLRLGGETTGRAA